MRMKFLSTLENGTTIIQQKKESLSSCAPQWKYLSTSFLKLDNEQHLGITSLTNTLREGLNTYLQQNCDGCKNNWDSQKDQACLILPIEDVQAGIDDVFKNINYQDFLVEFSKRARHTNIDIKAPFETFKLILLTREDHIKNKLLEVMS